MVLVVVTVLGVVGKSLKDQTIRCFAMATNFFQNSFLLSFLPKYCEGHFGIAILLLVVPPATPSTYPPIICSLDLVYKRRHSTA